MLNTQQFTKSWEEFFEGNLFSQNNENQPLILENAMDEAIKHVMEIYIEYFGARNMYLLSCCIYSFYIKICSYNKNSKETKNIEKKIKKIYDYLNHLFFEKITQKNNIFYKNQKRLKKIHGKVIKELYHQNYFFDNSDQSDPYFKTFFEAGMLPLNMAFEITPKIISEELKQETDKQPKNWQKAILISAAMCAMHNFWQRGIDKKTGEINSEESQLKEYNEIFFEFIFERIAVKKEKQK